MIYKYNYSMELWNMLEDDRKYSLQELLEVIYRINFILENKIEVKKMTREGVYEAIEEKLADDVELSDEFYEKEKDYIGNEIKRLNKMLDAIMGVENRKLIYERRNDTIFTRENCWFIYFLFSSFHTEDAKQLKKGKYYNVSREYYDFLYRGVKEFAQNDELKLTMDIVDEKWETEYYKSLSSFSNNCKKFMSDMHYVLNKAIHIYKKELKEGTVKKETKKTIINGDEIEYEVTLLDKIELEMLKFMCAIKELDDEFADIMIMRADYEDIEDNSENKGD